LEFVINHALKDESYQEIYLAGISMGGSQTLKYLGENAHQLNEKIKKAVVYSTPCNLPSSAATLRLKSNNFYKERFLKKLKAKMAQKADQFPDILDWQILDSIHDFDAFDTHITAKLHGFKDACDFYSSVSADNWMPQISIPTLVINALNDPLLGKECYPVELAEKHEFIYLEMPKRGGHTGFMVSGMEYTWAEGRFLEFLKH
jgi:predicted alpha/beta-fold hydrolase